MTHFKKQIIFSLLALSFLLLAACQGQETPSPSPPTAETSSPSPPPAETPSVSELPVTIEDAQALAQSVYEAIVGDHDSRDFYVEVAEHEGDRQTTRIHITSGNDPNVDFVGHYLFSFTWEFSEPCECATPLTLTLSSADGNVWLRCWEGCDQVTLHSDGQDYFLTAAPGDDGQTLLRFLLNIPEDALIRQTWTDIVIDGSVTDYNEVAELFTRQRAENMNALPDWVPNKPLEIQYCRSVVNQAYFGEGTENFCGYYSLYFKLDNGDNSVWQAGSGMDQETEGEYAGWWIWGLGIDFARNEDGDWICIGMYTGGARLIFPTPLEEASLEQLVDYFFHTFGSTRDYLIPLYIRRQPVSELERLDAILEGYPAEEAKGFCLALGAHLADYPDYEDLAYEDLAPLLAEPYRGWLTEGYNSASQN